MTLLLIVASLTYVALLFTVAHWGDKPNTLANQISYRPFVYSMSLAIYCSSWTYYGAVGNAAADGWAFLAILLGPFLLFIFGHSLLEKLVSVAKQQNVTSIADFIASRYGKRRHLALFVTLITALATIPYIALQLKAVGTAFTVLTADSSALSQFSINELGAAVIMAVFAMLFGTRHIEVTEYRSGMILAIAVESAVKLIALVTAAVVAYLIFRDLSPTSLSQHVLEASASQWRWQTLFEFDFIVQTLMAAGVILCLPRQFHVLVVDNAEVNHLKTARWGFPLYLFLVASAIIPIAISGGLLFGGDVSGDTYALQLPLLHDQTWLAVFIFIGGFSAATAMVIIASVTLSTMVSNDVIMPILLQRKRHLPVNFRPHLLKIRRIAIGMIMLFSYLCYYFWAAETALVSIGLLAFSVVLHLLPAMLGGLYWRRGHARGVYAGLIAGLLTWGFTVALPMFNALPQDDTSIITQGTAISMAVNLACYLVFSLLSPPRLIDRIQATAFVKPRVRGTAHLLTYPHQATNADLIVLLQTFVGEQRTYQLLSYFTEPDAPPNDTTTGVLPGHALATPAFIEYVEHALTSVLGAATARSLVEAALRDRRMHLEEVVNFFDDTTLALKTQQAILFNSLENLAQGISVVDAELRLVAWNKRYLELFNYPAGMVKPGQPIATLIRFNAERGECGPGEIDELVEKRLNYMQMGSAHRFIRRRGDGRVIEMVGNPLPNGGFVTSFTDITEHVETQQALQEANIDLEQRIDVRQQKIREINNELTEEIERRRRVEIELKKATEAAQQANASKTRFLALASHDILQPLNAARLYLSAVDESTMDPHNIQLLGKLDTALSSTEHLLSTLLQIAKMEQGALKPNFRNIHLSTILDPLLQEYSVMAEQQGVTLRVRPYPNRVVYTDPTYLRRIIQNFLSNAIKYNRPQGKVLLGVRARGDELKIAVWDTGPGIHAAQQLRIFDAFYRGSQSRVEGVGLGLSVAKRMSEQLGCELQLRTQEGKGSCFSVQVPIGDEAQVAKQQAHQYTADLHPGMVVICVDDDAENLNALRALLEKWGCTVETFTSSATALDYASRHPAPGGVLLDYQLGDDEHDGFSLAAALRERWQQPLQGALVTAMSDDDVRKRARHYGLHFLTKPIKPAALKALLKHLERHG